LLKKDHEERISGGFAQFLCDFNSETTSNFYSLFYLTKFYFFCITIFFLNIYVVAELLLKPNEDRLCLEESNLLLRFMKASLIEQSQAKFVRKQNKII
jgi:hypothetical protein